MNFNDFYCFYDFTHLCQKVVKLRFMHFSRKCFEAKKHAPQTFLLLEFYNVWSQYCKYCPLCIQ